MAFPGLKKRQTGTSATQRTTVGVPIHCPFCRWHGDRLSTLVTVCSEQAVLLRYYWLKNSGSILTNRLRTWKVCTATPCLVSAVWGEWSSRTMRVEKYEGHEQRACPRSNDEHECPTSKMSDVVNINIWRLWKSIFNSDLLLGECTACSSPVSTLRFGNRPVNSAGRCGTQANGFVYWNQDPQVVW